MRIAQTLAGISLAEADVLRKAVGKKDADLIRKELDKFEQKAVAKGLTRKPWVKTSLAPGSRDVTDYLNRAGLTPHLDAPEGGR